MTGQQRSIIPSPDGFARLEVPPLSLPTGIGALSIDREVQSLPADAPAADGAVYGIASSGLDFSAPVLPRAESTEGILRMMADP